MKRIGKAADAAERGLLGSSLLLLAALALGLVFTNPARAAGEGAGSGGAEKLRRLDIMLMVTGLRCRTTAEDFTADYGRFTASHLPELNQANDELRQDMTRRFGSAGAQRALDRLSTTMANGFGQGHPWLSCGELKMVARNLADVRGRQTLEEAADQLLSPTTPAIFALARR